MFSCSEFELFPLLLGGLLDASASDRLMVQWSTPLACQLSAQQDWSCENLSYWKVPPKIVLCLKGALEWKKISSGHGGAFIGEAPTISHRGL